MVNRENQITKIVIFGTGERGDEAYRIIQCLSRYKIVAFSDNDRSKWGTKRYGFDIISPNDIISRYKDASIVIASAYYVQIGTQLIKENIIPEGGFLESVNLIIGKLSEPDKTDLKSKLQDTIKYHNLDYKEVKPLNDNNTETGNYLVICNGGYPKENNHRSAFAHRRVLKYIENGIQIEAFGFIENSAFNEYHYQGIQVYEGGTSELQSLLSLKQYKKLLIHFIDEKIMYSIGRANNMNIPMIIWCHGYEITPWFRTWFNYSDDAINKYKESWYIQDKKRAEFLAYIFKMSNLHFIFVSNYLKNRVKKYVGELPDNYSHIPNFIDNKFYLVSDRDAKDRLHILSIKSHKAHTYANDLTAKAILELANRDFFSELTFELYGDGELFEENFGELQKRNYPNVHIHREFLSQEQMQEQFRENGVFLSPTRMDSHQVTSSEAMSAGMAVITCNVGPMQEFMDEECASLFEGENYFMMAEEIEYLYYHPEDFLKKCENAKIRAEKQCGYKNTIQKEIDLILS